jgi:4a-hydroxytetrahydrobiopterin dehydratase
VVSERRHGEQLKTWRGPMPELLKPEAIQTLLMEIPQWKLEGDVISRTVNFPSFLEAIDAVNNIAREAESANHHPDIDIRWRTVRLALSTHSVSGLTTIDFQLAKKLDQLLPS